MTAPTADLDLPALLGGRPVKPDGPPDWPPNWPEIRAAFDRAFASGNWGKYHGPDCRQLSAMLMQQLRVDFAELCCSGTAAVELALRAASVGPGDEVVLAGYEFEGNFRNILALGAMPVLVDIDPQRGALDPACLVGAVTKKTKAIIATHLHGGVVPMPQVVQFAQAHGLFVVEDACQMPGAIVEGRPAGTWGDIGVLSFGGSKLLTAGRGGALVSANAEWMQRVRLYCQRGNHAFPLSEIQAAVLIPQLQRLDDDNARRTANVALLLDLLRPFRFLKALVGGESHVQPGYYKLGFCYESEHLAGLCREAFVAATREEGIAFDVGFRSLHLSHSRRRFRAAGDLSNSSSIDGRIVVLHHPVLLGERHEIEEVAQAVGRVASHVEEIGRAWDNRSHAIE